MRFERWQKLMQAFDIEPNKNTYLALVKVYSEKHRYYHTVEHIAASLMHLDEVTKFAKQVNEIELALWFHDAIYRTFSASNELDSANWATDFLSQNGICNNIIERIHRLIMVTQHKHAALCNYSVDESLIVDIDLAIFGTHEDVYHQFEQAIRKEYKLVPEFIYKKKRKQVLNSFLQRDKIYQNRYFYEKLEAQARLNLANALFVL